ncbi:MAG TPA: hypothetical protein VGQ99_12595 [Tepidisphaeraceae bacterium]|jgi:uncharacterized membrane protein|nr:hypothetical protein [Tepidisphaeraceae bacterium]
MTIWIPKSRVPLLLEQMSRRGYKDASEYLLSLLKAELSPKERNAFEKMLRRVPKDSSTTTSSNETLRESRRRIVRKKSR